MKLWGKKQPNNKHTGTGKRWGLGQSLWGHGSRHKAAQGRAGIFGGVHYKK